MAVAENAQDDQVCDDSSKPTDHHIGGEAWQKQDPEPGGDLDDANAVHEVLGTHTNEIGKAHPQVLGPEGHPVEELVHSHEDRRRYERCAQDQVGLVRGVRKLLGWNGWQASGGTRRTCLSFGCSRRCHQLSLLSLKVIIMNFRTFRVLCQPKYVLE